jgi:DNA-binding CsgD family transcriptional regulator/N-acetylneuraminic acid mutarotase
MPTDDLQVLSERETDILKLLATGASNQEIARALVISPNTVKVHLRNIYEKLQVQSRTEATLVAIRAGLVAVETPSVPVSQSEQPVPVSVPAPVELPALAAPRPDLAPPPPIARWQRFFLLAMVGLALLALLLPWLQAVASQPAARQVDLVTDAQAPAVTLPTRQETQRWQTRAPLPGPRSRLALTAFRSQLYAIGGETPGGVTGSVDVYVPERNEWQPRSNLPRPLANVQAAVLKNLIYVPGGTLADGRITNGVVRYDAIADAWGEGPPLPEPRAGHALVSSGENLYLLGGFDGGGVVDSVLVFDPASGSWHDGPALPAPRAFAGATLLNNRIYLAGGFDGTQAANSLFVLDLDAAEPAWTTAAPMQSARSGLGLGTEGSALYAFGGGWDPALDFHERYDPFTNTWSTIASPFQGTWRHLGVATLGPMLHLAGGWNGNYSAAHEQYQAGFRTFMPVAPR